MNCINHITLHLTNRCNLFCRHCWVDASATAEADVIPLTVLENVLDQAAELGIQSIKLTGGEPFLYPNIRELILYLHEKGFNISIETNATLFKPSDFDLMKKCNCYIATSLDGYSSEYHNWFRKLDGCFDKTLNSIRQMVLYDIPFQIIWSVCKENEDHLEQMLELCKNESIGTIKVNPINLAGRILSTNEITLLNAEERVRLHEKIIALRNEYPSIYIAYPIPPAFMPVKEYLSFASECDFCSRCAILHNGDVGLCGADITAPTTLYGNIYHDALATILNNPKMFEQMSSIVESIGGVCDMCIHKKHCKGYCRANAVFVSNDVYAPYFLCQDMYNKGLFPKTRLKR